MSSQPNCVSCPININLADWVNENCRHLLCFKHSAEDNGRCAQQQHTLQGAGNCEVPGLAGAQSLLGAS
jgi:hypothetical protein